ncbi:coiled-coil domain-containing protein 6 isoform X1 [Hydra vulgaris]|uniref:coiled-coil domain-containing protein 6 isoform X1 n=1 Tax=Hydra vulgaris TaxID=6087 RepID=UPI001F5F551E|nr:coiled-coil domain-containing protein 6-like [Hydra vulgaris]
MATSRSLSSSSEALPGASDSDMSADEGGQGNDNRIQSLQQANRVLKMELEMYKLRCKQMQEENKTLRQASVSIQAKAEQEEEFISNTLMKKIHTLKKEKEILAMNYEEEEEYLTNDLSKKLFQLRNEKVQLEQTLEQEQEFQVNKLIRRIERLEAETISKQHLLEQLRKEKVDLENTLEQEQEALVNRLWVRMEKLEAEKRLLQQKLDQPISEPASPRKDTVFDLDVDNLSDNVNALRDEVLRLRSQLCSAAAEHSKTMSKFEEEENQLKEENVRLQRKLLLEMERREQLSRQLSESESSLEMDEERHFNELAAHGGPIAFRDRAISSPVPYPTRPKSPALHSAAGSNPSSCFTPPSPMTGNRVSSNVVGNSSPIAKVRQSNSPKWAQQSNVIDRSSSAAGAGIERPKSGQSMSKVVTGK